MLKRYEHVLKGAPARHKLLKAVKADQGYIHMDDASLMEYHDGHIGQYRDILKKYENITEIPESKSPSLLDVKIELAERSLKKCNFCAIKCGTDRHIKPGLCGVDAVSHISSEFLHTGEEPELVPSHTIFFEGCNMKCAYCQNWTISTRISGPTVDVEKLCSIIDRRYRQGSRNVNFVGGDPIPHLHTILKTIKCIGPNLPLIWNSNMYMSHESLKLLEGTIDVYLADLRYGNDEHALKYSKVKDYWENTTKAFLEANTQAELLVRHLVLPGHVECCTKPIIEWCARELGKDVRLNLMFQYHPEYHAFMYPEIDRHLTTAEINRSLKIAREAGLTNMV
jgi:putative pyruvate formate lyase activating enzyme